MDINELLVTVALTEVPDELKQKLRSSIELIAQNAHEEGVLAGVDKCIEAMDSGLERIKLLELRDKLQW